VPKFTGSNAERMTAYADELQAAIKGLDADNVCGWIVDLRQNSGGNVFAMLAGVGPILGEGDAGGGMAVDESEVMRTYDSGRSGRATISGEAYELLNPSPPVAILIGPNTASSGEAVALAFIGRPNTKTFGQKTAGYTTGNVPIPLSDGALLNLAVTTMMDRNRNVYKGPITPDVTVTSESDGGFETDLVVAAAAEWLKTNKDCASEN
jgi:C-terminal processing protease CtpA/Prc